MTDAIQPQPGVLFGRHDTISSMNHSQDASDEAFTQLFELFSKPIKSSQKAYRTYQLSFENGEPIFTLSDVDRMLEEIFEQIFCADTTD